MKARTVLFFATLVSACAFASITTVKAQVISPTAERPQYVAGEKWVFDRNGTREERIFMRYEGAFGVFKSIFNGRTYLTYSSPDGNLIKVADENGKVFWEHRGEYAMLRFPLRVGKTWSEGYYSRGSVSRWMYVRVTAWEEVIVPAGTFWAFKMEATNRRFNLSIPAYETYWYAPTVKNVVKYSSPDFEAEIKMIQYVPAPPAEPDNS